MDEIKLANRDIPDAEISFGWLSRREIPEPIGYRVGYTLAKAERTAELLRRQASRVGKRMADLDENGQPKTCTIGGVEQYVITEREEEHLAEMDRLMDEEVVLRVPTFTRKDFAFQVRGEDGKERPFHVPGFVWKGLLPFLREDEE